MAKNPIFVDTHRVYGHTDKRTFSTPFWNGHHLARTWFTKLVLLQVQMALALTEIT